MSPPERRDSSMENKALSDTAAGIFRLRKDDPHMTDSVIVDVHDETYTTLTTVEVRSGAVVLHCLTLLGAPRGRRNRRGRERRRGF